MNVPALRLVADQLEDEARTLVQDGFSEGGPAVRLRDQVVTAIEALLEELGEDRDGIRTPLVVVVRDPDASNDFQVFDGSAETYDVDLGRADLDDRDEFIEWAVSHAQSAAAFRAAGRTDAADYIETIVVDQSWPEELASVASLDALVELARQEGIA